MSSNPALSVKNLSKCYHIYDKPGDRLLQMLTRGRRRYFREFWALRDVSFDVRRGETVGVIGFNGAGKSTLLQLICGTLNPTGGSVQTAARTAALLELGSGFNPEFTGRENVFLNCALHGMSKREIEKRYPAIEEFAGIGSFIDQPVKLYSSGMFARLAFAAAVHVDPGLLIVDEALSVGDMAFQEKSINRMKEIRESGTSILFVSHSVSAVRYFCDTALWLDQGVVRAYGERLEVCDQYQAEVDARIRSDLAPIPSVDLAGATPPSAASQDRWLRIVSATSDQLSYRMGETITFRLSLEFFRPPRPYGVGFIIYDERGNVVSVLNTLRDDMIMREERTEWSVVIPDHHLAPGEYTVTVSIPDEHVMFSYDRLDHCIRFRVPMERNIRGFARVEGIVRCEHEWSSR